MCGLRQINKKNNERSSQYIFGLSKGLIILLICQQSDLESTGSEESADSLSEQPPQENQA